MHNKGMKQDELVGMLGSQPDFSESKPKLQEVLEAKGCRVLFGVKFHPELMMIESCYRYHKMSFKSFIKLLFVTIYTIYTNGRNCTRYTWPI